MKRPNRYTVPYRRKREGKTDYKKRIKLISSQMPRLVVRRTLNKIITQVTEFDIKGDRVLVGVDSTELKKLGWQGSVKNIPAAYMTGYLIGKKSIAKKINEAVLDLGFCTSVKGAKIYAALKGAIDAGMEISGSEEIFPTKERIEGKHIKQFKNKMEEIKNKIK